MSAFPRCIAPWSPILLYWRLIDMSVYGKRRINGFIESIIVRLIVLCFVLMHLQDVLLLDHRLYWKKAQVLWASAKSKELIFLRKGNREINHTLFWCNAFARYFAPWAPISFPMRINVLSVYKKWRINGSIESKVLRLMLLCFPKVHFQGVSLLDHRFH